MSFMVEVAITVLDYLARVFSWRMRSRPIAPYRKRGTKALRPGRYRRPRGRGFPTSIFRPTSWSEKSTWRVIRRLRLIVAVVAERVRHDDLRLRVNRSLAL